MKTGRVGEPGGWGFQVGRDTGTVRVRARGNAKWAVPQAEVVRAAAQWLGPAHQRQPLMPKTRSVVGSGGRWAALPSPDAAAE